jgi:hypothetical protein
MVLISKGLTAKALPRWGGFHHLATTRRVHPTNRSRSIAKWVTAPLNFGKL